MSWEEGGKRCWGGMKNFLWTFPCPRQGFSRGDGESRGLGRSEFTSQRASRIWAHQCDEFGVLNPLGLSPVPGKGVCSDFPEVGRSRVCVGSSAPVFGELEGEAGDTHAGKSPAFPER